jgi:hypothetical protein
LNYLYIFLFQKFLKNKNPQIPNKMNEFYWIIIFLQKMREEEIIITIANENIEQFEKKIKKIENLGQKV